MLVYQTTGYTYRIWIEKRLLVFDRVLPHSNIDGPEAEILARFEITDMWDMLKYMLITNSPYDRPLLRRRYEAMAADTVEKAVKGTLT